MKKVEILILGEEDLRDPKVQFDDITEYNVNHFNIEYRAFCEEYVIMFNDRFSRTIILKNRWGSNGIVNNKY